MNTSTFTSMLISDECTGDSRDSCERDAKMGGEGKPWFARGWRRIHGSISLFRAGWCWGESFARGHAEQIGELPRRIQRTRCALWINLDTIQEVDVYDVGSWFVAYLIHHEGEDAFVNGFYGDLDELGFDEAFERNFNATKADYLAEFDTFFAQPAEDVMMLFPEVSSPDENEQTEQDRLIRYDFKDCPGMLIYEFLAS